MKKEKGFMLLVTLFAIALMSTLFIGSMLLITTDLQITRNLKNSLTALTLAEAGIEAAINNLKQDYTWDAGYLDYEFPSSSGNKFTVQVTNTYPRVQVTSTGITSTGFSKTIIVKLNIQGPPLSPPYKIRIDSWQEN